MSWHENLRQVEIEKRRWAVLSHLEKSGPPHILNDEILIMGCRAAGVPTTSDELKDAILWLEERGYITTETLGGMLMATITKDGREIAQGLRTVPGLIPFGLDG